MRLSSLLSSVGEVSDPLVVPSEAYSEGHQAVFARHRVQRPRGSCSSSSCAGTNMTSSNVVLAPWHQACADLLHRVRRTSSSFLSSVAHEGSAVVQLSEHVQHADSFTPRAPGNNTRTISSSSHSSLFIATSFVTGKKVGKGIGAGVGGVMAADVALAVAQPPAIYPPAVEVPALPDLGALPSPPAIEPPFVPIMPEIRAPPMPEVKMPALTIAIPGLPGISLPSIPGIHIPGLCDAVPELCPPWPFPLTFPPMLPELPGLPKLWLPDLLRTFLTAIFLFSMRQLAKEPSSSLGVKETDMQIMTDYQSDQITHTDINNPDLFACGKLRRSMPVVSGSQGSSRTTNIPGQQGITEMQQKLFGASTKGNVVRAQHPLLELKDRRDMIHVHLEDLSEGNEVLWDADYNLRNTKLLTPFQQPVGGSKMDFGTFCPPLEDIPHRYELTVTDPSKNGEFIGSAILKTYYAKHDPLVELPPASNHDAFMNLVAR